MKTALLTTTMLAWTIASGQAAVGVNTQLSFPEYANLSVVQKALKDSGITNLRDNLAGYMSNPAPYDTLASQGYTFDLIAPNDGAVDVASTVAAYHAFAAAHPGALTTIEGSNEIDGWPVVFKGQSGIPGAVAWQDALYAAVKADPLLKNIPVIGQSCGQCSPDQFAQLNAGAHDINNAHVYVQGGATADAYFKTAIPYEVPNANGKPTVVTETGYTGAGGDLAGLASASAKAGAAGTYIYALLPSGPTAELQGYGIYNADGTPKPEATALRAALNGSTGPSTPSAPPPAAAAPSTVSGASTTVSGASTTVSGASTTQAANSSPTQPAAITPGKGSVTDAQGHVWEITASGSITKDGQYVPGGGGTSALTIGADGTVLGKDNGHGPVNPGGWFSFTGQNWSPSAGPTGTAPPAAPGALTQPGSTALPSSGQIHITQAVCGNGTPTGSFHVADGHLLGPDGKEWIARGINVADNDLGAADQMIAMFPGLNFVRLAIYQYRDPSFYAAFIDKMTARGTVVEFEHHVETNGATGGGGQGDIASGAWLSAESEFYRVVAAANKSNPYVWFGTTNEPPNANGLSQWQQATYQAIRGTGNTSIILLEIMGWPGAWNNALDPSVYASMKNVVWDTHFYGWVARDAEHPNGFSTNDATINQALSDEIKQVQQIKSADGTIPAIVAEHGPSTTGQSLDVNGMQAVDAVINSSGGLNNGNAAWHWGMQDCCNNLNSGSAMTELGQKMAMYIGTSVQPCTAQQTAANAALNLTEITQQAAAPDSTQTASPPADPTQPDTSVPATPVVDMASIQAQIDAADAAIASANAALKQIQATP